MAGARRAAVAQIKLTHAFANSTWQQQKKESGQWGNDRE
jgi:hypothetical protein